MNIKIEPQHSSKDTTPVDPKVLNVHPLIATRTSCGSFADGDLDWSSIVRLLHAARCAPSARNSQPWRFIVMRRGPGRAEVDREIADAGSPWAVRAPVLIAVAMDLPSSIQLAGIEYALFDCGLAVQNLLLQANSIGLAAHIVGYEHHETMRQALHLPDTLQLILLIALGWPGEEKMVTYSSRGRKSLSEIATWDLWDGPSVLG